MTALTSNVNDGCHGDTTLAREGDPRQDSIRRLAVAAATTDRPRCQS
jgi:hypothetical protein